MKRILVIAGLLAGLCAGASAESSVWKVEKDGNVLYLGATCHILRQSDYPLPAEYETAYKASGALVFEADIAKLKEPATQQDLLARAMYPVGDTIEKHLSPKAYAELSAYCTSNHVPLAALSRFKPSILMVTLTVLELNKLGVSQEGVDQHFHDKALADRKAVEGLETVEQQIGFVVSMSDGIEDQFVSYSIQDMGSIKAQFEAIVAAWRAGDDAKLNDLMTAEFREKMPALYKKLVSDRSASWVPGIEALQKTPRVEFVLVGAAHLVGPDGLVDLLKAKGYSVEKL